MAARPAVAPHLRSSWSGASPNCSIGGSKEGYDDLEHSTPEMASRDPIIKKACCQVALFAKQFFAMSSNEHQSHSQVYHFGWYSNHQKHGWDSHPIAVPIIFLEAELVEVSSNLMSFSPWRWSLLLHGPSVAVASAAVLSGCGRAGSLGARLQALHVLKHGSMGTHIL